MDSSFNSHRQLVHAPLRVSRAHAAIMLACSVGHVARLERRGLLKALPRATRYDKTYYRVEDIRRLACGDEGDADAQA